MEQIAYIYTTLILDAYTNINIDVVPVGLKFNFFTTLNSKKLSSSTIGVKLSIILTLGILTVGEQALGLQKEGTQGAQVTSVQKCLQKLGYFSGPVTGKFGPLTQNGVMRFQKANRLTADGVIGSRTQQLLQSQCHSKTSSGGHVSGELELGSTGPAVRKLHQDLQQLGFFQGPITSYFGPQTEQAVIRFQKSRGIPAMGVVGVRTQQAIRASLGRTPSKPIGGDTRPIGITYGAAGVEVTELQLSLQQLGYFNSNPTGYFGPATRDAIIRFQQNNGIVPNGIADSQTLGAISRALGSQSNDQNYGQNPGQNPYCTTDTDICQGERSQRVAAVQQRLQQWGFYRGDVTGYYDPATRDAVVQFQRYYGIFPSGAVNYQTRLALGIGNLEDTTPGNLTPKNRYVVVIPLHKNDTLELVRQYVPEAFPARSRLGPYVNAGQFKDRSDAEKLSQALRSRGLDARVEFF